jgi:hypothetical protein
MSYASGGLIQASDYNGFQGSVNTLWGAGSGGYGYGQGSTLAAVSAASQTVAASEWATLIARITSMQQHQSNNTSGVPSQPTSGSIVTYLSTLNSAITTITNNRFNTAAYGTDITAANATSSSWYNYKHSAYSVTFGSYDQARYFFNAGGRIYQSMSVSGSLTSKDTDWQGLVQNGVAYNYIDANNQYRSGSGYNQTIFSNTYGFLNIPNNNNAYETLRLYSTSGTDSYSSNYAQCYWRLNNNVITLYYYLVDAAPDSRGSGAGATTTPNTGTYTHSIIVRPPWTTYISNSWGTPSISYVENSLS